MRERLQKVLSQAGVASRRKSEELIKEGRVKVNNRRVGKLGRKVDPEKDKIEVDGKEVKVPEELIYLAVNKPYGYITSRRGQYGRRTVYHLLPKEIRKKVWSVGRLDYRSEGLLIFTNDGELTQKLTHPKFEHEKEYEVEVGSKIDKKDMKELEKGVDIGGYITAKAKVEVVNSKTVRITIGEGRKRQIRRMLDAIGYSVIKLTRIRVGKLELKDLKLRPGEVREIKKEDIL